MLMETLRSASRNVFEQPWTKDVSREDRPEWDTVLSWASCVSVKQITGARWIKSSVVSDTVAKIETMAV